MQWVVGGILQVISDIQNVFNLFNDINSVVQFFFEEVVVLVEQVGYLDVEVNNFLSQVWFV